MTEEKTLEEVLFDLLGRGFGIIFSPIQTVNSEQTKECVFVKLVKGNHVISRAIEKELLAHGLLYWAKELNENYEFEMQHLREVK